MLEAFVMLALLTVGVSFAAVGFAYLAELATRIVEDWLGPPNSKG